MIRVVFDTVVLVRSLINPHSYWGRLIFEHATEYHLIVSLPTLREALEVLRRPRLQRKYRALATRNIETVIACLSNAQVVEIGNVPRIARDPNDDISLATAEVGGAQYIVSEDDDLLTPGQHRGIAIVTAEAFLGILEQRRAS